MKYRTFPGTDLSVNERGFGTWTRSTGWRGEKTDDEAVAMLCRARRQSELPENLSSEYMHFAVDRCLDRLETDYIDVLQPKVTMERVTS